MKKFSLIIMLAIVTLFIVTGCKEPDFNGSCTGNGEQFLIDYSIMNCTRTNFMNLKKGESINTIIDNKSGRLDILITDSNGEKIYKGDDVTSGNFSVEVPKADEYKITVTGKKAKGNVSFKVDK
jgi:hypothetical protein